MKRDVELLPPALLNTCLANSNMKCAKASEGLLGSDGYALFPLNRWFTLMLGKEVRTEFVIS